MLPGTLFQCMGPWYANACCPYDLVHAAAMLRIFGSNDERSGLAGVYTFNSSKYEVDEKKYIKKDMLENGSFLQT